MIAIVLAYSSLRFVESYGLWRQRAWAEWLAIVSGAMYLPFELVNLIRHPSRVHWAVLLINIAIVVYIAWVRWDEIRSGSARQRSTGTGARWGLSIPSWQYRLAVHCTLLALTFRQDL